MDASPLSWLWVVLVIATIAAMVYMARAAGRRQPPGQA